MEAAAFFLLFLFLIALIATVGSHFITNHHQCSNLPPGTFGCPLIGETLAYFRASKNRTLQTFLTDRIQRHGSPVFKTSLLGHPTAAFCGAAGNKFLFSNENKLVSGTWPASLLNLMPSSIMANTGDDHAIMQGHIMAFLKPDALQKYVGRMDAVVKRHVRDEWEGKGEVVTVLPRVKRLIFTLACCLFASVEDAGRMERMSAHLKDLIGGVFSVPVAIPGSSFYRGRRAANALRAVLMQLIGERREELADGRVERKHDMLSHLLGFPNKEGRFMTEAEVVDNMLVLLFSSQDTTASALTSLMKSLAEFPHVYSEVLKEQMEIAASKGPDELLTWGDVQKMHYSWNVVREVLRISPPAEAGLRQAITDFDYGGFHIPKGWKLHWNVYTTHMNPEYFPEPKKFNPSRFEGEGPPPYSFIPFGGGPRMCPGKEYARLEILVFLHNIVRKFSWEVVFPDEEVVNDPLPVPIKGLPIRLRPHSSI